MIEADGLSKRFGATIAGRPAQLHDPARPGHWFSRAEWRGQDHGHAAHPRPGRIPAPAPSPSTACPMRNWPARCARSGRCWRPGRCMAAGAPAITCAAWPRPMAFRSGGRMKRSASSGCPAWPVSGPGDSRSGMSQRLGIAAALLGDPGIVMFDEPVNGLDPEGILWIRTLMRSLAAEGRTVFVSSHLMSEMENTADHLIVIGRGPLIAMAAWPSSSPGAPARRCSHGRRSRTARWPWAVTAAGGTGDSGLRGPIWKCAAWPRGPDR